MGLYRTKIKRKINRNILTRKLRYKKLQQKTICLNMRSVAYSSYNFTLLSSSCRERTLLTRQKELDPAVGKSLYAKYLHRSPKAKERERKLIGPTDQQLQVARVTGLSFLIASCLHKWTTAYVWSARYIILRMRAYIKHKPVSNWKIITSLDIYHKHVHTTETGSPTFSGSRQP